MKKSALYTATGDDGTTSLVGGTRVKKTSARLEAYGTIDELNSFIGVLLAMWRDAFGREQPDTATLVSVQNKLFDIGAYLATDNTDNPSLPCRGVDSAVVAALEKAIDEADLAVTPMKCFVLPGGCRVASHAHVARAVARRAERRVLALADEGATVAPEVVCYLNRLSDYLFALARLSNNLTGVPDTPWSKS